MNEIEQTFYDAYMALKYADEIQSQAVIGIYKVDFLVSDKYVVEIDGHEFHKTKEQRETDYKRERYLIKRGYIPIRFTGTEVFLEADKCVQEVNDITAICCNKEDRLSDYNTSYGRCSIANKVRALLNDELIPKMRAILDTAQMPPEEEE